MENSVTKEPHSKSHGAVPPIIFAANTIKEYGLTRTFLLQSNSPTFRNGGTGGILKRYIVDSECVMWTV